MLIERYRKLLSEFHEKTTTFRNRGLLLLVTAANNFTTARELAVLSLFDPFFEDLEIEEIRFSQNLPLEINSQKKPPNIIVRGNDTVWRSGRLPYRCRAADESWLTHILCFMTTKTYFCQSFLRCRFFISDLNISLSDSNVFTVRFTSTVQY